MPRSISRVVLWCGLLALAAASGGCQRRPTWELAPVEGTVTKNGRPLRNVEVVFLADLNAGTKGLRASGRTDEAGHYRLRTDDGNDGAIAGKHRILILDLEVAERQALRILRGRQRNEAAPPLPAMTKRLEEQRKTATETPRLPPRYGRINETPLRAEVRHEPLIFDIVIP